MTNNNLRPIYVFLDEGGNFDFSANGTRFFTLTSVTKNRPFQAYNKLIELRYDLIEEGIDLEYFHASEDRQAVRNKVFDVMKTFLSNFRVNSVIIEKRKTGTALQEASKFYPRMLGYLLRHLLQKLNMNSFSEVIVITDRIPVHRKRNAIEQAVKQTLKEMLPDKNKYRILHHDSKSSVGLQIADYFNWAIFRAWEKDDKRSLNTILDAVKSQFDIFKRGKRFYY